jgi:hypothetical protein
MERKTPLKVYLDKATSSSANCKLLAKFEALPTSKLEEANVFVSGMSWTTMCSKARASQIPVVKEDWIIDSAMKSSCQDFKPYMCRLLEKVKFVYANLLNTKRFEDLVKENGGILMTEEESKVNKFDILVYNPANQPSELAVYALFRDRAPMIPEVDFYKIIDDANKGKPLLFVPDYPLVRE